MSERILLAHGGGGRLTRDLIRREIASRFRLGELPDAATVCTSADKLLFTTDGFVVQPIFFPGGDIGRLAVFGTVNDLAVSGARARWLSCTLILEEGLQLETLRTILDSMKEAAETCQVDIVTGDTKVVPHGQCDGIYISTAGIGEKLGGFELGVQRIRPGDEILVSGPLGEHGLAVLAARKAAPIVNQLTSDAASVQPLVLSLSALARTVKFMRDPTRGGLAAVCHELVEGRSIGLEIYEGELPRARAASSLAEVLGLDLLHSASEGRIVAVCEAGASKSILEEWRGIPEGREAAVIGRVTAEASRAILVTGTGGRRLIDLPDGELLPRIC